MKYVSRKIDDGKKEIMLNGRVPEEQNDASLPPVPVLSGKEEKRLDTPRDADLVCFSHLRWDFVYQRPQHLLSRAARERRVFFIEEPVFGEGSLRIECSEKDSGVVVVVPHLPMGLSSDVATGAVLRGLLDRLFASHGIRHYILWYYTPMALSFSAHLQPLLTIYDCMDELAAFKGAPPSLCQFEQQLFHRADLVFTGGQSLYEAKRSQHNAVHAFPSSIDREHFARARQPLQEPEDQVDIPQPRLGFCGVIDERFDRELLAAIASLRPDWQFVMVGPVVKIAPESLPQRENIHYLGSKRYQQLPDYLASWDVALLLFARNEATRFISPTKTPEYLAAGKPVVSTSIKDVVRPYGEKGLVQIANRPEEFCEAIETLLTGKYNHDEWLSRVDEFLSHSSWDRTWWSMSRLIDETMAARRLVRAKGMKVAAGSKPGSSSISLAS